MKIFHSTKIFHLFFLFWIIIFIVFGMIWLFISTFGWFLGTLLVLLNAFLTGIVSGCLEVCKKGAGEGRCGIGNVSPLISAFHGKNVPLWHYDTEIVRHCFMYF